MKWKLIYAGRTDIGRQREINEDSLSILPEYNLFIVADGMGGHKAGEVASHLALKSIKEFFKLTEKEDTTWPYKYEPSLSQEENRILGAISLANSYIYEASKNNKSQQGMGTTIVSCIFSQDKNKVYIAHVGDSRCYQIRAHKIKQLTIDHSLFYEVKQAMPHLSNQQLMNVPKNVITRALGVSDSVKVDLQGEEIQLGDIYLLCSDGLNTMVEEEDILKIIEDNSDDLERACDALIEKANENGGEDNITVVLIKVVEATE